MERVIELIRVSTEQQADDDRGGIPAQRAANLRTAELYGLEIIRTVELIDVSGAAVLAEPAMLQLLQDIRRDDVHGVVTREFSRLMRPENYADFAILQSFKETNTLLYLPEGPLDFSSRTGRLMGTIRAAIAAEERETIRERMMGGKEALRRMGRWAAGNHQLPFAVDYDRNTYKFSYKPEAQKVHEVFRRFLAGDQNYDALSDYLGLTRGTAKNILQNPIYTGWLVFSERRDLSSKGQRVGPAGHPLRDRRKIDRPEEETYRNKVIDPGLISDEDFARVQEMVAKKQELAVRQRTKVGRFTYNGFLWCAQCGARIHTLENQFDRYYYICSNKKRKDFAGACLCPYTSYMNRDKLEPLLDDLISRKLTDPKVLQDIYDQQRRQLESKSPTQDRELIEEQYKACYAKRDRVIDMAADGIISKAACSEKLKVIDEEIRALSAKLTEANPVPAWSPAQVGEMFAPLVGWPSLDRAARRRLLNGLAPKFEIANYEIHGLYLGLSGCTEPITVDINTQSDYPRAAASLPARCEETRAARRGTARHCARERPHRGAAPCLHRSARRR
jgi:DNA invertase Pin-like site-specific DNA recombinase